MLQPARDRGAPDIRGERASAMKPRTPLGSTLTRCVRCGADLRPEELPQTCRAAPDHGPHEGIDGPPEYDRFVHGVRQGSSLHVGDCPLSNPSPWAHGSPCFCPPVAASPREQTQ